MATEAWDRLKGLGYRVWWKGIELTKSGPLVPFVRDAKPFELEPYLPMERVHRALSVGTGWVFSGFYRTDLLEKLGREDHSYYYSFHAGFLIKEGKIEIPVHLLVEISGRLSGPFPEGGPVDHSFYSEMTVGDSYDPIPVGWGQKRLALSAAKRAVRAAEAFVSEFPDAKVYAVLETRGARDGWKRKVARWDLGSAQRLAQEGEVGE